MSEQKSLFNKKELPDGRVAVSLNSDLLFLLLCKTESSFFSQLLVSMTYVLDDTITSMVKISAVNHLVKIHPKAIDLYDKEQWGTVLTHLAMHVAFLHGIRRNQRDKELFNLACDIQVNARLEHLNNQDNVRAKPSAGFVIPATFAKYPHVQEIANLTVEEIYERLSAQDLQKLNPLDNLRNDIDFDEDEDESEENGGSEGCKSRQESLKAFVQQVAQNAKEQTGKMPGCYSDAEEAFLEAALKTQVDWKRVLFQFVQDLIKTPDLTYKRPHRRSYAISEIYNEDIILPSYDVEEVIKSFFVFKDVSSSLTENQLTYFLGEMNFLKRHFNPEMMRIVGFNSGIAFDIEVEESDTLSTANFNIGGGTALEPCWELLAQEREKPKFIIVFSDMYVDIPENPGVPVIWICLDNESCPNPPYGKIVHINSDDLYGTE